MGEGKDITELQVGSQSLKREHLFYSLKVEELIAKK